MQSSYQLKFTPIAEDDLDGIYLYISEHLAAPKAADDLMYDIETSIMRLKEFPYSGSPVQDDILSSIGAVGSFLPHILQPKAAEPQMLSSPGLMYFPGQ